MSLGLRRTIEYVANRSEQQLLILLILDKPAQFRGERSDCHEVSHQLRHEGHAVHPVVAWDRRVLDKAPGFLALLLATRMGSGSGTRPDDGRQNARDHYH